MRTLTIPLLTLWLVGCTSGVNPPKQPRLDPHVPGQVHVDSKGLELDTAVGTPVVTRDDVGNLVHVTLPIRSTINKTLYVDYWVTFFDRNGHQLSKLGPFTKTLQANTPDSIHVNSMSPRAADFQIDLRYAR
jgi:hypothetical protein